MYLIRIHEYTTITQTLSQLKQVCSSYDYHCLRFNWRVYSTTCCIALLTHTQTYTLTPSYSNVLVESLFLRLQNNKHQQNGITIIPTNINDCVNDYCNAVILFARSFDLLIIISPCAAFGIHFLIYIASVKCSGNSNIKQQTRTVICLSLFYIRTRDFISIAHSKTLGSMKNLWRRRQHSAKKITSKTTRNTTFRLLWGCQTRFVLLEFRHCTFIYDICVLHPKHCCFAIWKLVCRMITLI